MGGVSPGSARTVRRSLLRTGPEETFRRPACWVGACLGPGRTSAAWESLDVDILHTRQAIARQLMRPARRDQRGEPRIESVPGQQAVGTIAARPGIRDPRNRPAAALEKPDRCGLIRRYRAADLRFADSLGSCLGLALSCLQGGIDDRSIDAALRQLSSQRTLAARPRSVSRLHPGACERLIVQHPEVGKPLDGALDQILAIAGAHEAAPNFADRSLARLEEAESSVEDDSRIIDLRATGSLLGERFP